MVYVDVMNIRYTDSVENAVKAHESALTYGAIVGYTYNKEKEKFGLIHWGFAKDLVSARKTADILEAMMETQKQKT